MYYLILNLLLLFGITSCEESTPNVTIIWKAESLNLKYGTPILLEKQQFRIMVETSPFNAKDLFSIECYNDKETRNVFINETLMNDNGRYVTNVSQANERMTKTWNCDIKRKSNTEKVLFISFSAHIRLMKTPGEIRVNDQKITLSLTDLSVSDFDAVGTYYYVDGELAKFTCHREKGNKIYNYNKFFFNVSDTRHETGTELNDVSLYLKLGHNYSPKHIDCTIGALFKTNINYNIRLILKPFTNNIEYPQFQVNGLSLTPSKNEFGHNYTFVYEYYPGEELIVLSNLNPNRYNSLSCDGIHMLESGKIPELTIRIDPLKHSQALYCSAKMSKWFFTDEFIRISIKFIEDSMKFSPYITGIQWQRIIAKFYNNVNYNKGTFYASYDSDTNTTLHCSSHTTGAKWNYGVEVNSTLLTATKTESEYSNLTNYFISSRTFQLNENVSETTLECKHDNATSKVVLIQQKELSKPSTQVTSSENTENSNSNTNADITPTNYSNSNNENKSDDTGNIFLPIIFGVISVIIILLIITLIVCICNRKKLPKTDTDINYENLPAHNEGSMPIPSQWDTNRIKTENIEDAYAKVIPKSQRTKLTDIYSEPLSKIENPCYASPYNANLESPYAEIISKSQRKENVPSESENVDNYAQIVPKAVRNVAKNQVLPANDDHGENGTKIRNRADTDKHKYANVFNSEMYANVSSSGC